MFIPHISHTFGTEFCCGFCQNIVAWNIIIFNLFIIFYLFFW